MITAMRPLVLRAWAAAARAARRIAGLESPSAKPTPLMPKPASVLAISVSVPP